MTIKRTIAVLCADGRDAENWVHIDGFFRTKDAKISRRRVAIGDEIEFRLYTPDEARHVRGLTFDAVIYTDQLHRSAHGFSEKQRKVDFLRDMARECCR